MLIRRNDGSMLRLDFYQRAIRSIHPLCSLRSTPTWPFDVKPPTYEPIGLIPTRESSVLFEIILHQALKQTGGTTRDCRSCLQVHNFLLMEGWSAFYRKFLRISDIRELWAATRILSRGSMSASSSFYVCRFFSNLNSRVSYLSFLVFFFSHSYTISITSI